MKDKLFNSENWFYYLQVKRVAAKKKFITEKMSDLEKRVYLIVKSRTKNSNIKHQKRFIGLNPYSEEKICSSCKTELPNYMFSLIKDSKPNLWKLNDDCVVCQQLAYDEELKHIGREYLVLNEVEDSGYFRLLELIQKLKNRDEKLAVSALKMIHNKMDIDEMCIRMSILMQSKSEKTSKIKNVAENC